jgi:hypothetical protein
MANHRSSFFLNRILRIFQENGLFEHPNAQKAVLEAVQYGCEEQDCNGGAVLEEVGAQLGICYSCLQAAPQLSRGGLCAACLEKM